MTLPATVTIVDKPFAVWPTYSRNLGREGSLNRDVQGIVLYYDRRTTNSEMLDTLLHEYVEAWAMMMCIHYRGQGGDNIVITLNHTHVIALASALAGITASILTANGGGYDPLAPYAPKVKP